MTCISNKVEVGWGRVLITLILIRALMANLNEWNMLKKRTRLTSPVTIYENPKYKV